MYNIYSIYVIYLERDKLVKILKILNKFTQTQLNYQTYSVVKMNKDSSYSIQEATSTKAKFIP